MQSRPLDQFRTAADRQDVLQQAGGHTVGHQRGPARLEIEQLRGGMLGEEPGQRAEALGNPGLAEAAMKTWADQRDGAEGSAELDPAPPLTQKHSAAEITAPMPLQKARRLGTHHAFLDANQYGLGVGERQADRLQSVIVLVEMQDLVFADYTVVVADDPELDLDTHARPKGCHCQSATLSADTTADHTHLPHFALLPQVTMPRLVTQLRAIGIVI